MTGVRPGGRDISRELGLEHVARVRTVVTSMEAVNNSRKAAKENLNLNHSRLAGSFPKPIR